MAIRASINMKGVVNQIRTNSLVSEAEQFGWDPTKIKIEAIKRGLWTDPSVQEYYSTKKGIDTQTKQTEFNEFATTQPEFNFPDAGEDAPILSMGGDTVTGIQQPAMRERITAPAPTSGELRNRAGEMQISDDPTVQSTIQSRQYGEEMGATSPDMDRFGARLAAYGATNATPTPAYENALGDIPTRYQKAQEDRRDTDLDYKNRRLDFDQWKAMLTDAQRRTGKIVDIESKMTSVGQAIVGAEQDLKTVLNPKGMFGDPLTGEEKDNYVKENGGYIDMLRDNVVELKKIKNYLREMQAGLRTPHAKRPTYTFGQDNPAANNPPAPARKPVGSNPRFKILYEE